QADGGILYFHVTGVQTCALPIFLLGDVSLEQLPAELESADPQPLPRLVRGPGLLLGRICTRRARGNTRLDEGADRAAAKRSDVEIGRASCRAREKHIEDSLTGEE